MQNNQIIKVIPTLILEEFSFLLIIMFSMFVWTQIVSGQSLKVYSVQEDSLKVNLLKANVLLSAKL